MREGTFFLACDGTEVGFEKKQTTGEKDGLPIKSLDDMGALLRDRKGQSGGCMGQIKIRLYEILRIDTYRSRNSEADGRRGVSTSITYRLFIKRCLVNISLAF